MLAASQLIPPMASMDPVVADQPLERITLGDSEITVLGTAHVSRASAETVRALLNTETFDAVAVELCPSRYNAIVSPESIARMDLFKVLREGKIPMVTASLALGAYQQRLAEQFGIEPGAEMRAAIEVARERGLTVLLIDREVGITLKRVYRSVPWWKRMGLLGGLMASVVSREKITEEEIEKLKEGDILETTFAQFAEQEQELYAPLIDERDRYMSARLREIAESKEHGHILAVVGAGHLQGIASRLRAGELESPTSVIAELDQLPPPSRWPRLIPWIVVAIIVAGFVYGFTRGTQLGLQLVMDWVLINGSLAAVGAALAGAHPLTTVTAFVAAPLTSLNPTIGAGMVTAAVEIYLRKPQVGDFAKLRSDTASLKGWWRNKVARVLLVFVLSTAGSAAGTYIAGFRIFERLLN